MTAVSFLFYYVYSNSISVTIYSIVDDQYGGDCNTIGNWDLSSKTCTISSDLPVGHSIHLDSNGITLDGNGKTISGNGENIGVKLFSKTQITVKNLNIVNFENGVFLQNSIGNTITNLNITFTKMHGVHLIDSSNNNTISFNEIGNNFEHGIRIDDSNGNLIIGNTIKQTKDGIRLQDSNNNIITKNTLTENRVEGIDLHTSMGNRVYHNNLIESEAVPIINSPSELPNVYFINSGGNYYSTFDEPSEGCFNQNLDDFCDSPYDFKGGQDSMAFIKQDGWIYQK